MSSYVAQHCRDRSTNLTAMVKYECVERMKTFSVCFGTVFLQDAMSKTLWSACEGNRQSSYLVNHGYPTQTGHRGTCTAELNPPQGGTVYVTVLDCHALVWMETKRMRKNICDRKGNIFMKQFKITEMSELKYDNNVNSYQGFLFQLNSKFCFLLNTHLILQL